MLIGQGANDPRVKEAESEQIVDAIAKHRGSAVYALYTDEGHGFVRPENRLDFTARMEKFLADNLGGRYEPMKEVESPARPQSSASSARRLKTRADVSPISYAMKLGRRACLALA